MTSQAPCRCVDNILITYDENKAKAHIPTHSLNNIYEATAAYEKRILFFFNLVNQKSLSHIIRTLLKKETSSNWYYY